METSESQAARGTVSPPTISLFRDRLPAHGSSVTRLPGAEPLEADTYLADCVRLAHGDGLETAARVGRATFRLDAFGGDFSMRIDRELTAMREDIEARLARGFEVRFVRCFAIKFDALWFTDPSDAAHRRDHYLPVPPVPYYLEAGCEYSAADLRAILIEPARACAPALEINRRFIERIDRETVFQADDPTI